MTIYNFSAGPACLPHSVLTQAQQDLVHYPGAGISVMEMSHRSADFENILHDAKTRLRKLANIPDDYDIIFLQGGASLQFSMIPMNLAPKAVDIIDTGQWTSKAIKEHQKCTQVNVIASSKDKNYTYIPKLDQALTGDYLYICENNTIYGTQYHQLPHAKHLIGDLSSDILSRPLDITKYDLVFAGAQKNIGPAGLTLVILKKSLLDQIDDSQIPSVLSYKVQASNQSMFNTPPTWAIYICSLVFKWLEEEIGGLEAMERINQQKAKLLYDYLDQSTFFHNPVNPQDRSLMNIPFISPNAELDQLFIAKAKEAGLINLKGHRSVGGMRASLYNAMPIEGVQKLIELMQTFEGEHHA